MHRQIHTAYNSYTTTKSSRANGLSQFPLTQACGVICPHRQEALPRLPPKVGLITADCSLFPWDVALFTVESNTSLKPLNLRDREWLPWPHLIPFIPSPF